MSFEELDSLPAWRTMETITLGEMSAIKLMNRIDTKFIAPVGLLPVILERAVGLYRVQEVGVSPVAHYDTLYYDTPQKSMYTLHHDGHLCRQKIRTRTYLDSDSLSFLEIKNKTNTGRTKKKRIEIPRAEFEGFAADPAARQFMAERSNYPIEELKPEVRTIFNRITLVNKALTERLTIDTDLRFENLSTGHAAGLGEAMIIELKRDGQSSSPMMAILTELRIKPAKVSKYCVGTVLTNPDVKSNRFKERIRKIEKISNKSLSCQY